MSEAVRHTRHAAWRDAIAVLGERMESVRQAVERQDAAGRAVLERTLDTLRGQRNRAMARVEAARQSSDDGWPFARAHAEQAIADLAAALDEMEASVSRAAA